MKTRFIIIGFGWRADFFYRIAKMMPERFEISAGVLRTKQRAEEVARKRHDAGDADHRGPGVVAYEE